METFGCGVENLILTLAITIDLKRVKFRHVVPSSCTIHTYASLQPPAAGLHSILSAAGNRTLRLWFFLDTDGV